MITDIGDENDSMQNTMYHDVMSEGVNSSKLRGVRVCGSVVISDITSSYSIH
jgi:hypothetical protein